MERVYRQSSAVYGGRRTLKNKATRKDFDKITIKRKKGLRVLTTNLRTPLPERHTVRYGSPDGRDELETVGSASETRENSEIRLAGRARNNWRIQFIFVSTLFEIDISEEICGRFGSVRWIRRLYINASRGNPMI